MLVPAGVLVLIMLGSIACDSALAYMGQRELQNLTEAVANDSATAAASSSEYSISGKDVQPTNDQLVDFANRRFAESPTSGLVIDSYSSQLADNGRVVVQARGHVNYLFARAIPGMSHSQQVVAQATSRAATN